LGEGGAENTLTCLPPKLIKLTMENKYFNGAFVEAAKNSMFQHHWMPIETWAALINHYYKPPLSLLLDRNKLLSAVT